MEEHNGSGTEHVDIDDYGIDEPLMNFFGFLKFWLKERVSYQAWILVDIKPEPQEGDIVKAILKPNTECQSSWGHSDFMKPCNKCCYMGPFCLVNYKLTVYDAAKLITNLDIIQAFHGLTVDEAFAFMIQATLVLLEYDRYLNGRWSCLFQVLPDEIAIKDYSKYPKQLSDYLLETPLLAFEKVLEVWGFVGGKLFSGFMPQKRPDMAPGKWCYLSLPPIWLTVEQITELCTQNNIELPAVPIYIHIKDLPLVEQISKIPRMVDTKIKPLIAALTNFAELAGRPLDQNAIDATPKRHIEKIPVPADLKWEDIKIVLISDDAIKIQAADIVKKVTYSQIGFVDERKGNMPDSRWKLLMYLAMHSGEIIPEETIRNVKLFGRMKAGVKDLRKRLKMIFELAEDPFYPYRKTTYKGNSYKTKFDIFDARYGRTPSCDHVDPTNS